MLREEITNFIHEKGYMTKHLCIPMPIPHHYKLLVYDLPKNEAETEEIIDDLIQLIDPIHTIWGVM